MRLTSVNHLPVSRPAQALGRFNSARQDAAFGIEQVKISGLAAGLGAQCGLTGRLAPFR
jgi:hypothetical protein